MEGYEELEEEDDMEDFGNFPMNDTLGDDSEGSILSPFLIPSKK